MDARFRLQPIWTNGARETLRLAMRRERVSVSRMSSALLTRVDFRDTLLGEIFVGFLDFRMCKLLRLDVTPAGRALFRVLVVDLVGRNGVRPSI